MSFKHAEGLGGNHTTIMILVVLMVTVGMVLHHCIALSRVDVANAKTARVSRRCHLLLLLG